MGLRHQPQRPIEALERFVEAMHLLQCNSVIAERIGPIGAYCQRSAKRGTRLLVTLQYAQRVALIGVRFGKIGPQRDRSVEAG